MTNMAEKTSNLDKQRLIKKNFKEKKDNLKKKIKELKWKFQ